MYLDFICFYLQTIDCVSACFLDFKDNKMDREEEFNTFNKNVK